MVKLFSAQPQVITSAKQIVLVSDDKLAAT